MGILMRKYGQEVIKATAGKKVHGTGAIPGGINKNRSIAGRDALLVDLAQMREWSRAAVKVAKDYTLANLKDIADFGSFPSNHVCLVRQDGALDLYDGGLRAVDANGKILFDHLDPQAYLTKIAEEVRPWS